MDWRHEAMEKLEQYDARQRALDNIPEEIRRLETEIISMRSSLRNATPAHGKGSSREDAMLTNIVRRDELARQLENTKAWVKVVDRGLGALTEEERLVLDRFYIHRIRGHVERLSGELGLESKMVYRRKDSALRRFTVAMYGGMES